MSQTVITLAFEQYKAQQEADLTPVVLDEFVLANVPNQDASQPIDRNEGLPPLAQIVLVSDVSKAGYVNPNAVVYSLLMDTTIGDFDFNWIGLRNKASGVIAAISHIPTVHKLKTVLGVQNGNSVTRSIMMSYSDAKGLTNIDVDASTWQIDFTARLFGIDEAERLANFDVFGQAAFLSDGFKVEKSGSHYIAKAGRGYVGGLRCQLDSDLTLTNISNSKGIYLDASWQGQLTSEWQTVFVIKASNTALVDYVDGHGYQHYVTKIADVDSAGNVIDVRYVEGFAEYVRTEQHANQSEAEAGTSSAKWMSPLRTQQWWNQAKTKAQTVTALWTFSLFKLKSSDVNNPELQVEGHRSTLTNLIGSLKFINRFNGQTFTLSVDGNGLLKWLTYKIYHEGNKPTKSDVGLSNVPNYTATSATNDASTSKFALAKGVKDACDLAKSKMKQSDGDTRYWLKSETVSNADKLDGVQLDEFFKKGDGAGGAPAGIILKNHDNGYSTYLTARDGSLMSLETCGIGDKDGDSSKSFFSIDSSHVWFNPNGGTSATGYKLFGEHYRNLSDSLTSSSKVVGASSFAVKSVNDLVVSHNNAINPHPQYLHNDEHATQDEAVAGTSTAKWSSPLRVKQAFLAWLSNSYTGSSTSKAVTEKALKDGLATKSASNHHHSSDYISQGAKATLTDNDGYGNANLTFNHKDCIPKQSGSSGRIECSTDTTTASMSIELGDNVASGVAKTLTEVVKLTTSAISLLKNTTVTGIFNATSEVREKGVRVHSPNNKQVSILARKTSATPWLLAYQNYGTWINYNALNHIISAQADYQIIVKLPIYLMMGEANGDNYYAARLKVGSTVVDTSSNQIISGMGHGQILTLIFSGSINTNELITLELYRSFSSSTAKMYVCCDSEGTGINQAGMLAVMEVTKL